MTGAAPFTARPLPPERAPLPYDEDWVLSGTAETAEVASAIAAVDSPSEARPGTPERLTGLVRCIDLTSLNGDDTPDTIRALCMRARDPLDGTANAADGVRVAAACVHPFFLSLAQSELAGSGVSVAVVAGGFPSGMSLLRQRVAEVRECAERGADEIDTVINRSLALTAEWRRLYDELAAQRDAAGAAVLKVILATGELRSLENVERASRVALLAGADFIKTSTGKEAVNATFPAGRVMLRTIRDHEARTGRRAGFKAAGGIRSPEQGLAWSRLVEETLGEDRTGPDSFRIGASGLLGEIVSRLGNGEPPAAATPPGY